jgi:hypothetical protein
MIRIWVLKSALLQRVLDSAATLSVFVINFLDSRFPGCDGNHQAPLSFELLD